MTDLDLDRIREYAADAWHAAVERDTRAVIEALVKIGDNHRGLDALAVAALIWCDTTLHLIGVTPGSVTGVAWRQRSAVFRADDVDPAPRWAGRLIAARGANDPDTWAALWLAAPWGTDAIGVHLLGLLSVCTNTAARGPAANTTVSERPR